jgi:valyl-tRNA synthetase
VTGNLPPGKEFPLAGGSVVFPAVKGGDPVITRKRIDALQKDLDRVEAKLANPGFVAKAPPEEVEKQRGRADEIREEIARLSDLI